MRVLLALFLISHALAFAQEQIWIPMKVNSLFGGERTLKLEATLYKPSGEGPFPLLLFSHGSTGNVIPPTRTLRPDWLAPLALERGMVLLAPMRRGRGASEGSYNEAYSCDFAQLEAGMRTAMEDVDAALAYAKSLSFVDPARIVLAGNSRGGILSVVYAAKRPGAVAAVLNFVGGWHGERCNTDFNTHSFTNAGRASATPMLWLYAEGDSYYSPVAIRKYALSFEQAGGRLALHLYPPTGKDGHFFYRSSHQWLNDVGAFLDAAGFPAGSALRR